MSKINYIPRSRNFLVETKEKTEKGIFLPDSALKNIVESLVDTPQFIVCASEECTFVKEGDYVLLEPHVVDTVKIEGKIYLQIPEFRVMGKVPNYVPPVERPKIELKA